MMTAEEHKAKHKELCKCLGELVADFVYWTKRSPREATVMDLIEWSELQALRPDEKKRGKNEG